MNRCCLGLASKLALALGACAADVAPTQPALPLVPIAQMVEQAPAARLPTMGATACVARAAHDLPHRLSELGCFDAGDPRWPAPTTVAFDVNAPLWTDGAEKARFFALPPGSRIELDARGDFLLPVGSVLVKTFSLGGSPLETRVLMHAETGWHGASYRWIADGSDAELAPEAGLELPEAGPNAQPWTIPARDRCFSCHDNSSHVALGLELAQLDRDFTDPHTGQSGNQLDRLIALGLLDPAHPALAQRAALPKLADYRDPSQPLADRARAYLHANCSSCHSSAQGYCTGDLRWDTPDSAMGLMDVVPSYVDPSFGFPADARLIAPGDPERSALVHRMRASGSPLAMPPIGRRQIDAAGVALIRAWIAGMRPSASL